MQEAATALICTLMPAIEPVTIVRPSISFLVSLMHLLARHCSCRPCNTLLSHTTENLAVFSMMPC